MTKEKTITAQKRCKNNEMDEGKRGVSGAVVTLGVAADVVLGGLEVISVFSSLRERNSFTARRLFIVLHV